MTQSNVTTDYYRINFYDGANHTNNVTFVDHNLGRLLELVNTELPVYQNLSEWLRENSVAVWGLDGRYTIVLSLHTKDHIICPVGAFDIPL